MRNKLVVLLVIFGIVAFVAIRMFVSRKVSETSDYVIEPEFQGRICEIRFNRGVAIIRSCAGEKVGFGLYRALDTNESIFDYMEVGDSLRIDSPLITVIRAGRSRDFLPNRGWPRSQ